VSVELDTKREETNVDEVGEQYKALLDDKNELTETQ